MDGMRMALMDRRVRSGLDLISVINQGYFMTSAQELCGKFFDIVAAHLDAKGEQYVRELRELQGECIDLRNETDLPELGSRYNTTASSLATLDYGTLEALEQAIQGQIENTESLISNGIYA